MTAKQMRPLRPLVRERGTKETVALTVRLPRGEWERVHHLAVSEGVSIQALAVRVLSLVFKEKGSAPIKLS
jgi:hypothetical protein